MRSGAFAAGAAGAVLAALFHAAPAAAQASPTCGVTGDATAPATISYDPFSSTGLSQATIPLVLRRERGTSTARTTEVSLILVAPAGTPPLTITHQGFNVLYREGATAGRPRALTSVDRGAGAAGEIRYDFGSGNSAPDLSAPLDLRVTVPPGTDLSAGEPIVLDLLYICAGTAGMANVSVPERSIGAIRINVNTLSALQASYAGSVIDFGEIGDLPPAAVLAAPDLYTSPASNSVRVRSSGPFEVRVRSQNDFRLTFPGGNLADSNQRIRYRVRFLGRDVLSNASFGTRTCARAGVAGAGAVLPIRATLLEGGAAKTPSPNYGDTVTITFTPLIAGGSAQSCSGL